MKSLKRTGEMSDSNLERTLLDHLEKKLGIDLRTLLIAVKNSEVSLSGNAAAVEERRLIRRGALEVPGVRRVLCHQVVDAVQKEQDREDHHALWQSLLPLRQHPGNELRIAVSSGRVCISGCVGSRQERWQATMMARRNGANVVINRLTVRDDRDC